MIDVIAEDMHAPVAEACRELYSRNDGNKVVGRRERLRESEDGVVIRDSDGRAANGTRGCDKIGGRAGSVGGGGVEMEVRA
jgi:hypothetical protein